VDLNGLCRELAQLLGSTTLKRIRIGLDLQETLGLVEGDAGALSHALMNLAVNALDAMPDGGGLEIRTRLLPDGLIELSVKDTGAGMTPEVLKRALEPFFTTKPVGQGSGLGLAMVYGTMQAHKGVIEVRSEPGLGTEVLLRFTALPALAAVQPRDDADAGSGAPARGLRFLLVDDDELIREALPPLVELLGPEVLTAAGGLEALALLEQGLEVNLVILDMNMPGLNGEQTLGRILALRPDQRVLLASGYTDQDTAGLVARNPTVDAISKPFTLAELRDKLAAFGMPAR
jgi:CheY-like chemotaxis protein/anti-sigma regulatory factor (Ser/Thr protein kinase)